MLQVKKNMNSNGETSISTDDRRVHRIDINRIPRQPLYFQLCLGMRNQGRPRSRFKDVAKRNMKWRDIDLDGRRRPTTDLPHLPGGLIKLS